MEINGDAVLTSSHPFSYIEIELHGEWNDVEALDIELPMHCDILVGDDGVLFRTQFQAEFCITSH